MSSLFYHLDKDVDPFECLMLEMYSITIVIALIRLSLFFFRIKGRGGGGGGGVAHHTSLIGASVRMSHDIMVREQENWLSQVDWK